MQAIDTISVASHVSKLIQSLCPDGVKFTSLISVADILYGYPCDASKFNEDKNGLPLVRIRDVLAGKTTTYTTEEVPQNYIVSTGDLLVGMDGNFHVSTWKMSDSILCQRVCRIRSKDEAVTCSGFLNHLLPPIIKDIEQNKQSGTVKHLLAKDINSIKIPLPPLPVQQEIVRILDNYTELTTELNKNLEEELAARRKQYEHYRDELIQELCSDGVEYKELQTVLKIKNGSDYKSFGEGDVPVYGTGGVMAHIDHFAYDKPSVLIPRKGSIDKLYYVDTPFWNVDTIFYTEINTDLAMPRYVYHCLLREHLEKLNTAGGVPSLTQAVLNRVKIPVPPLEVQNRVVSILDRFDAICNDLTSGLPAEIASRQKQYEYYRDKLLTFKELEG